eukprot:TRINITY_DN266_c4_g1_i1.p1 TRINITY_DN266_c4_g1~~TRINITY_DN266_c4_g1_i1.p1  ORF type:complete len:582 (+),score=238.45 TRINITY_DN266_c4_g1_i1:102-1847(+)
MEFRETFEIPLAFNNYNKNATINDALDALLAADKVFDSVLDRIGGSVKKQQERLNNLLGRIDTAQSEIESIASNRTEATTVYSSSRYPGKISGQEELLFTKTDPSEAFASAQQLQNELEILQHELKRDTGHMSATLLDTVETIRTSKKEKIPWNPKQGLGHPSAHSRSIVDRLLFNSHINPFKPVDEDDEEGVDNMSSMTRRKSIAEETNILFAAPKTLVDGDELPEMNQTLGYQNAHMKLSEHEQWQLPDLPLPDVANLSFQIEDQETSIAPSYLMKGSPTPPAPSATSNIPAPSAPMAPPMAPQAPLPPQVAKPTTQLPPPPPSCPSGPTSTKPLPPPLPKATSTLPPPLPRGAVLPPPKAGPSQLPPPPKAGPSRLPPPPPAGPAAGTAAPKPPAAPAAGGRAGLLAALNNPNNFKKLKKTATKEPKRPIEVASEPAADMSNPLMAALMAKHKRMLGTKPAGGDKKPANSEETDKIVAPETKKNKKKKMDKSFSDSEEEDTDDDDDDDNDGIKAAVVENKNDSNESDDDESDDDDEVNARSKKAAFSARFGKKRPAFRRERSFNDDDTDDESGFSDSD